MTTTTTRRRQWTTLEAPQVALLVVLLVVIDAVLSLAMFAVIGDARCESFTCRVHGVSVTRPVVGVVLAAVITVAPVLIAWHRRSGMRTVLVVQAVAGALLISSAVSAVGAAQSVRIDPPAVPVVPTLRPCVAVTLQGMTCVTYPPSATTP